MNKKLQPVIDELVKKYNLSENEVIEIINSPYVFTEKTIGALDLKDVTEEEFGELKTNFIYKYLGKFHTNFPTIAYNRRRINNLKKNKK